MNTINLNKEWIDIPNYEGYYQININGEVKSCERIVSFKQRTAITTKKVKSKYLKPCKDKDGYFFYPLCKEGKPKNHSIHRLLASIFIENPLKKEQVNHINGIKTDNRISNLEWVTSKENSIHAFDTGLRGKGEYHPMAKLTQSQVNKIRSLRKSKTLSQAKIGAMFGVCQSTIGRIENHKRYLVSGE